MAVANSAANREKHKSHSLCRVWLVLSSLVGNARARISRERTRSFKKTGAAKSENLNFTEKQTRCLRTSIQRSVLTTSPSDSDPLASRYLTRNEDFKKALCRFFLICTLGAADTWRRPTRTSHPRLNEGFRK